VLQKFSRVNTYFQGWITISKILENFYPQNTYVALWYIYSGLDLDQIGLIDLMVATRVEPDPNPN